MHRFAEWVPIGRFTRRSRTTRRGNGHHLLDSRPRAAKLDPVEWGDLLGDVLERKGEG